MIGGGALKIDPTNIEFIINWIVPTNVTEPRSFDGETHFLWNFIAYFSVISTPLHAITTSGKSF